VNANLVGQGSPRKLHSTHPEAFHCYTSFLLKTGHQQLGPREFRHPQGGILVVTKRNRYGAKLRLGKKPEGKGGRRFMPNDWRRKSSHNGIVIV
jgi:hypothetical protein